LDSERRSEDDDGKSRRARCADNTLHRLIFVARPPASPARPLNASMT
jgi:hypothetical protein